MCEIQFNFLNHILLLLLLLILLSGLQIRMCIEKLYFYFSSKTYVVGTQKNRLNETVL